MSSDIKCFLQNPDVTCREEPPEGAVLFNPVEDTVMILNQTGLEIWKCCHECRTIDSIVSCFLEIFSDVDLNTVQTDIRESVNNLTNRGFLTIDESC